MSKSSLFIGAGAITFGIFELSRGRNEEFLMYAMLGVAFIITWISYREGMAPNMKKILTILSWVMIGAAAFMFLFVIRSDSER